MRPPMCMGVTAKMRDIDKQEVIEILNDHVHRLTTSPTKEHAENLLLVLEPVFSALFNTYAE
jgi:hypothetical protein